MRRTYLDYPLSTSAKQILDLNKITWAMKSKEEPDTTVIFFPEETQVRTSEDGMLASYLLPTGEEIQYSKSEGNEGIRYCRLDIGTSLFKMSLEDYLQGVLKTVGTKEYIDTLTMGTMGLIGESGEIVDLMKKYLFHGHINDIHFKQKLKKEFGDLLWYLVALANAQDVNITLLFEEAVFAGSANNSTSVEGKLKESCLQLAKYVGRVAYIVEDGMVPPQKGISTYTFMCRLADVLVAMTDMLIILELDMNEIMRMNIAKLKKRYPQGFSSEASRSREVE